ncbi:MarR family transcriptional regulator [Nocardia sp. NBC_00508]|uniref:MarR family winged helix-turn-helix transcriptional regulator n=1 Tax=Nocardia sp. NBC_00508 TaxID=2975992 RepID=UPI002E8212C8|nr:MarR family transcriptional regulator [Nocardia sp. NBC_00508]WUD64345.1 MarR family transcriptional regulator [Nocardia sp. NBC_00508]
MSRPSPAMLSWRNLHLVHTAVGQQLDARLTAEAACSLVEHDLMAWLATESDGLRMGDLAKALAVTPGGLTRIVDRLAKRAWVVRGPVERNRREVRATLSPEGRVALRKARRVYGSVLAETLAAQLSEEELETLGRLSGKVLDGIMPNRQA